ncbi:MAG: hypothetical protein MUD03_10165 [Pirellula sp.]|jgi:hypothetical protein|nr:hypothetical protein [Pirellula sp.]
MKDWFFPTEKMGLDDMRAIEEGLSLSVRYLVSRHARIAVVMKLVDRESVMDSVAELCDKSGPSRSYVLLLTG